MGTGCDAPVAIIAFYGKAGLSSPTMIRTLLTTKGISVDPSKGFSRTMDDLLSSTTLFGAMT